MLTYLMVGIMFLVSACSTSTAPQVGSSPVKKMMSQASCDAWSKKVEALREQVGKCTADNDCVTDHTGHSDTDHCWNQAEFYNQSADYSSFVSYRDKYYATCQVAFALNCEGGPSSLSCHSGQCLPKY